MIGNDTHVIKGIHYHTNKPIEVSVVNGQIKTIKDIPLEEDIEFIIAPGLVDLQINGFTGIDFNMNPLNSLEWKKVIQNLSSVGVTTFYPTMITNSKDQLSFLFQETMKQLLSGNIKKSLIGGFHLEGPYISKEDGPRGAHSKDFVRKPDWEEFCQLQEKAQGNIKIITLSPEWPESISFIEKAAKSGVKVAIGHTAANAKQVQAAVEAGAELSTHLGNGAHLSLPRHPNYLWDQLAEESLWSSVISDGNHLPKNVLKVIDQVKKEQMILISDSVALAGMEAGDYKTPIGGEVTLTDYGRLHLKNNFNLLAGSSQYLLQGVKKLVDDNISNLGESINKASVYPSKLMGLPQMYGLLPGAPADLILFKKGNLNWDIVQTYKDGNIIYQKGSE